MELLLDNNYQIIKKLIKLEELPRDQDGYLTEEYHIEQEKLKLQNMNMVLMDMIKNTVEILKYLDKLDFCQSEIEQTKEECISRLTSYFSLTKVPLIEYFVQIYIKLLSNKIKQVDISY